MKVLRPNEILRWITERKYLFFCFLLLSFVFMQLVDPGYADARNESFSITLLHAFILSLISWDLLRLRTTRILWLLGFVLLTLFSKYAFSQGEDGLALIEVALALRIGFCVVIIWLLISSLLRKVELGQDDIFAALSVYLLVGIVFAEAYLLLLVNYPQETLSIPFGELKIGDVFYFSFITLSTIGFGDITPLSPVARGLTIVEGVIGVTFLATIVARTVSRQHHRDQASENRLDQD
ncbi:MAG: ion channel [Verrucomicrobiota bacterium]